MISLITDLLKKQYLACFLVFLGINHNISKMKLIFTISSILLFGINCNAQKVFSVEYPNQADVKVFVVDYENQADLKVYKVNYNNQAGKNDGKWFFTKYANQAEKKVFFVEYQNQADLKIFFVNYENQAGWGNKSKQHLMY